MLASWLTFFIAVTLISLFISAFLTETRPFLSIPFIFIGMIFSVICAYGFWDVEWAVIYSDDTFAMESVNYGEPYSYIFVFLFFVFFLFFIRAGWFSWKESLQTKNEINYSDKRNYMR